MRYIVMECHTSYAVVLDEDGCFFKVANLHYEVGQVVEEVVKMQEPSKKALSFFSRRWIYAAAALAACVALVFGSFMLSVPRPYASVYISINPAVRIDVDKEDKVLRMEGTNADGVALLEGYIYKGKSLEPVMDEVFDKAMQDGYLSEGKTITIDLDSRDVEWVSSHELSIGKHTDEFFRDKISVEVHIKATAGDKPTESSVMTQAQEGSAQSSTAPQSFVIEVGDEEESDDDADESGSRAGEDIDEEERESSKDTSRAGTTGAAGDSAYETSGQDADDDSEAWQSENQDDDREDETSTLPHTEAAGDSEYAAEAGDADERGNED